MAVTPTVTIGVPVRNRAATIVRGLENLLRQTHPAFEIVVSDDASVDDTAERVEALAGGERRVTLHRHAREIGPLANALYVLDAAGTDLFMWKGADDLVAPDYVERLVAMLAGRPDAVGAVGDAIAFRVGRFRKVVQRGGLPASAFRPLDAPLVEVQPTWLFGLHRTESLRAVMACLDAEFRHAWGWEILAIVGLTLAGPLLHAPDALLYRVHEPDAPRPRRPGSAALTEIREDAGRVVDTLLRSRADGEDQAGLRQGLMNLIRARIEARSAALG